MKTSVFDKIDAYFESKEKKEFYYTIFGIVAGIGFIIFYFITPEADNFLKQQKQEFNNLTTNLNKNRVALNVARANKIKLERKLKDLNKQLVALNKDKVFYSQLVNLLDFAKFNKFDWAQFVKTSIVDARVQGLDVLLVQNIDINEENSKNKNKKISNSKNSIVKKAGFGLTLKGGYKNFVYYMYKYENIKPLIRVNSFEMTSPNKYYIEFDLYGYEL